MSWDDFFFVLDFQLLEQLLAVIDQEIDKLEGAYSGHPDPDGAGLFDRTNDVCGLGFVACQQYLNVTYPKLGFSKTDRSTAIQGGPQYSEHVSYAQAIDAAANFWKHQGEWDGAGTRERNTRAVLDRIYPTSDSYVMANVLHRLLGEPETPRFAGFAARLREWRDALKK
jgi:hypothetical protein